jgi:hypothetical protein
MNKFSLYNSNEEEPTVPLKRVRQTCGLVTLMTEQEFRRFLGVLENDFADAKIIYHTVSSGRLWIMKGDPKENTDAQR